MEPELATADPILVSAEDLADIRKVENFIIKKYEIKEPEKMYTTTRKWDVIENKHLIWFLAKIEMEVGPVAIGRVFGCDHSTVSVKVKQIKNRMEVEKNFRDKMNQLTLEFQITNGR